LALQPQRSAKHIPSLSEGGVHDRSCFLFPGSEHLLVFFHPEIDPSLARWLIKAGKRFSVMPDSIEKMTLLSKRVQKSLGRDGRTGIRPFTKRRYDALVSRESALLGDFLSIRSGVCRHTSLVLQVSFQYFIGDPRYKFRWISGRLRSVLGDGEVLYDGAHAFVRAEDTKQGGCYLFDPKQRVHGVKVEKGRGGSFVVTKKDFFFGRTTLTYEPIVGDSVYSSGYLLNRKEIEDLVRMRVLPLRSIEILYPG
jgi:hypothetical protein